MMQFRDMELDFDLLDADHAEAYEEALEGLQDTKGKPAAKATLSAVIRWECKKAFTFFDTLFGEGFHVQLFGERANLTECINALEEFINLANTQREELDSRVATLQAQAAENSLKSANRATRRAASRTPTATTAGKK